MQTQVFFKIFIFIFINAVQAFADHPNEGKFVVEQLIAEAEANSLEFKQAQEAQRASEYQLYSKYGQYSPKISIEGGPLSTKFRNENKNGTAVYGKAEWNFYNGGADQAEIEKAKIQNDLQLKKLENIKFRIQLNVKRIYFELMYILESIALKEKAISINAEQMKLAMAKSASGFTSKSDVIEFELRESTLKSDLVLFNMERDQKSRELSILLARKNDLSPIDVKGHLVRESINLDREKLLNAIRIKNIEIYDALALVELQSLDKKIIRSDFLPKINFQATYGKLANEEMVYDENNNYSLLLKISIPLYSGFETINASRGLEANIIHKKLEAEQKQLSVNLDLENTLTQIKSLNQRLDLEEKNLSRSEDYYKITLSDYKRGIKNSPDMVGAAERLLAARIRNLEHRKDLTLAYLKIYELTGSDPTQHRSH